MDYNLFLDDVRELRTIYPGADPSGWVICRSYDEAVDAVRRSWPEFVSFDHDLGDGVPSGMDFAKFLVAHDLDHGGMPDGFRYAVHSANPPGAANINGLLANYLDLRRR